MVHLLTPASGVKVGDVIGKYTVTHIFKETFRVIIVMKTPGGESLEMAHKGYEALFVQREE